MAINPTPIMGTKGSETLRGTADNDTIFPIAGNDNVFAGTGIDTVVYTGLLASYRITVSPSKVVGVRGDTPVTTTDAGVTSTAIVPTLAILNEVERIRFDDKIYVLDTGVGSHAHQISTLYAAAGAPISDLQSVASWLRVADQLDSHSKLATAIINAYAPGVSDNDFVTFLYGSLTGGARISTQDLATFTSMIGTGKTFANQGEVFAAVASLPEVTSMAKVVSLVGTFQTINVSDYGI